MIKETIKLYEYQEVATTFVLDNINQTHVLLAAAPNAGKTFMASFIIKQLIKGDSRVLCSVHGTNVLKRQFYDSVYDIVGSDNVSIYDTSNLSLYDPSKPVQVMIYQNGKQMEECVEEYGKFDYLVVDEAHKYYDSTTSMETIDEKYVNGNHLLLTGSPAIFKEKIISGDIRAKYISASLIESTHSGQYDKDIQLDVVSNDVHLTIDDYNQGGEVTEKSQKKLTNNKAVLESVLIGDFGKTIIYLKGIGQANEIEKYLNSRGITNLISHSETDKDSSNIDEFKNEYSGIHNVVLIVVGRATEGFDDPNVSIIDMTYSKNIDTLYQRYSRTIRNRTDAKDKRYVKVVPNNGNSAEVYVHIMTAVLMLLKQEHYENFNGSNFSVPTFKPDVIKKPKSGVGTVKSYCTKKTHKTNDITNNNIIIKSKDKPVSVEDLVYNEDFNVSVKVDDKVYEITTDDYGEWVEKLSGDDYVITIEKTNDKVDDCLLMETNLYSGSFFDTKDELYGLITRYATNSLRDVLKNLNSDVYATAEEHIEFIRKNNLSYSTHYGNKYKHSELNLHSTPWNCYGNGSTKDYFDSIWGGYADSVEHIKFIKNNNIKSGTHYNKIYKQSVVKLHSNPWNKFSHYGAVEYFQAVWGDLSFASADEHIKFIKNNNIKSGVKYLSRYKGSTLKLHSSPWEKYGNQSRSKYFNSIWGSYVSENEHILFIKENKLKNRGDYLNILKNVDVKLHTRPWRKFSDDNSVNYFNKIWGVEFCDKHQHIVYIKSNEIKTGSQYCKLYKNSGFRLHSKPWRKYGNGSEKDYFESIWGKKEEYISPEKTFTICINNKITNISLYKQYRKSNQKLKLFANPYKKHDGVTTSKEYWNLVKEAINEKESKTREYHQAYLGEFSEMNKKWNTSNSKTTHDRLKEDKSEWVKYHKLYSESRKNWGTIPYKEIANKLKDRPEWLVGDFGCGENLLKTEITNKVLSFDHVAIDDTVTSCDLTNVPLEDSILDVVVFSLSLMGTNYKDYFKEAYRTLKPMGMVVICEPSTRWEEREDVLRELLTESGLNVSGDIKHTDKFIYVTAIKL